jgi:hypothetical protein
MFYTYINGTNPDLTDDLVTNYILDNYYDVYTKYHNNEFQWHDKLDSYRDEIIKKAKEVPPDNEYVIALDISFGNYDFKNNGFSVKINDGTFIPFQSNKYRYMNYVGLYLKEFTKYNFIAMDKDTANVYISSHTSKGENVNRTVTLLIYFKIAQDWNTEEYANISNNNNKYYWVFGNIEKINVYDDNTEVGSLTIHHPEER